MLKIKQSISKINLLYEIMNEAIMLPLFYFMGKVISDRDAFTNSGMNFGWMKELIRVGGISGLETFYDSCTWLR